MRFRLIAVSFLGLYTIVASESQSTVIPANTDTFLIDWAKRETRRSVASLTSSAVYSELLVASGELEASEAKSSSLGAHDLVFGDSIYSVRRDREHPAGVWSRSDYSAFLKGTPRWEQLIDVGALGNREEKNWAFSSAECLTGSSRCLIKFRDYTNSLVTTREWDTIQKSFVAGGFEYSCDTAPPPGKTIPAAPELSWRSLDSVFIKADFGPDTVSKTGRFNTIRVWQRGMPLSFAKEVFRNPFGDDSINTWAYRRVAGSDGVPYFEYGASGKAADRSIEAQRTFLHGDRPVIVKAALSEVSGIYSDQLIMNCSGNDTGGSFCALHLNGQKGEPPQVIWAPGPTQRAVRRLVTPHGVLLNYIDNVNARLVMLRYARGKWKTIEIAVPDHAYITMNGGVSDARQIAIGIETLASSRENYILDLKTARLNLSGDGEQLNARKYRVDQYFAISADGTRIPYYVARRADVTFNGSVPTIMEAYGNFGVFGPYFRQAVRALWLDRGGVFVHANVRGGHEFANWLLQGAARAKIEEDVLAVAGDIAKRGISNPKNLGIMGHSMGGLLSATMYTRHRDMFSAFAIENAVLDSVRTRRMELDTKEAGGRYGAENDGAAQEYVQQTSPMQNLKWSPAAPPILIATSTDDTNVTPDGPRSFALRVKSLDLPFFFWETPRGDHHYCTPFVDCVQYEALKYSYFWDRLGNRPKTKPVFLPFAS